jgi:murein DD-endopeptidase MepM/ murein hydrolase activator NlpD
LKGKSNEITAMSSCLADYTKLEETSSLEGCTNKLTSGEKSRVRRSAAMIGLAISMGATGMVFSQDKAAMAADSLTNHSTIPSLPSISEAQAQEHQLAPLALKHKVEIGESLLKLAKEYQVQPEAIASMNNIAITAKLEPGQTLKIPSVKDSVEKITPKSSRETKSDSKSAGAKSVNTSLDHLRETRQRLKESLVELKTEEAKTPLKTSTVIADVSDVSQPLKHPEAEPEFAEVAASVEVEIAQAIEIPVFTPESQENNVSSPQPKDEGTSVKVSVLENTAESTLPVVPSLQQQTTAKLEPNQPIPINVISPEAKTPEVRQNIEVTTPEQTSFRQPRTVVPQPSVRITQKSYRVRPGDTLNSIARNHGISATQLIRANGITNANLIKVNQTLVIPQTTTVANSTPSPRNSLPSVFDGLPSQRNQAPRSFVSSNQTQPVEIQISTVQESQKEKLKADIVSLQQGYGQRSGEISLEQKSFQSSNKTVVGEALNPEWAGTTQSGSRRNRQAITSPQQAIDERLNNRQPELISAAPSNPSVYNNAFEIPIGTSVGPDLPGISNPDDYLPDAPMRFTGHIWPSKGVLTSGFGRRWGRMHKGIDIAAPVGTPIMASAPGEVISAGWNSGGYGNLVKVRHPDGSVTLYAHNSRILVRRGQKVDQGQQIAEMGSTGFSTGPHLHYEIHASGRGAQNPMAFLPRKR